MVLHNRESLALHILAGFISQLKPFALPPLIERRKPPMPPRRPNMPDSATCCETFSAIRFGLWPSTRRVPTKGFKGASLHLLLLSQASWRNHIDRSSSPRLFRVTFKRQFGALATQALVLLRLTTSTTRRTNQKKVHRRPVTPTFFRNKPIGEHVEGHSLFRDESCGMTLEFKSCNTMEQCPARFDITSFAATL
jgi:hypothetical protein